MWLIFVFAAVLVARFDFAVSQGDACDVACIQIYQPVCASCSGVLRTFSNECELGRHNGCNPLDICTEIRAGECTSTSESPSTGCPSACSKIYKPVCAQCPDGQRTFSNSCMLRKTNCESRGQCDQLYEGECRTVRLPLPPLCTTQYSPVCASCSGGLRTFSNECLLRSNNFRNPSDSCRKISNGVCRVECPMLNCQTVHEPVCALCGFQLRTFDNECIFRSYNCPTGFQCKLLRQGSC